MSKERFEENEVGGGTSFVRFFATCFLLLLRACREEGIIEVNSQFIKLFAK